MLDETEIFVFPAANNKAQENLLKSIEKPVEPERVILDAFEDDPEDLHNHLNWIKDTAGGFYAWGSEPRDTEPYAPFAWRKMQRGDYVLAYYYKGYHYVARVLSPFHRPKVAKNIWGINKNSGNTWEYMYFLTKPISIDAPAWWVADLLGRDESSLIYQGFNRIAGENRKAILQRFGSVRNFINQLIDHGGDGIHPDLLVATAKSETIAETSLAIDEIAHGNQLDKRIPDEEGRKSIGQHVRYERSSKNRALAIEIHGTVCVVCGFDFDKIYGADYADGYIQVHHKKPLSEHQGKVDPETDLVPLCANCHVMSHRRRVSLTSIEELKELLEKAKG
jgi:hypothetical protein